MASILAVLLLLSAGLFTLGFGDDCQENQDLCNLFLSDNGNVGITSTVLAVVVFIAVFIICCVCPCCCIYKTCRKPRPAVATNVTTVTNTNVIQQQPVMQGGQYPQYQPVPTQPGYGGQPMQTGPYQGQLYAPGPPPSYHTPILEMSECKLQRPGHEPVCMPSDTTNQPAYNPAYVQPQNNG